MARILVLAKSGFGKTSSYCRRDKLGIKGLDPSETYVIQCINRAIPSPDYKLTPVDKVEQGNRVQIGDISGLDRFKKLAEVITTLSVKESPFKNIIIDDFNYLSQDYYMANSMKGGWQTPKDIGWGMGVIFEAMMKVPESKNIICLAHYEEYKDKNGDSISYKFKSTGNMVDAYITPEGKFDIILYGKQGWDDTKKIPIKQFVINFDGEYPAKDSIGVLDDLPIYIPNDLSIVVDKLKKYYNQ